VHSGSKIIVTGGAGFIGSHLVPKLLSDGHEVLVIDNLSTGRRECVPSQADFVEVDLARADEACISRLFRDYEPDAVIHLAAMHYIPHCLAKPVETFLSNVHSTEVIVRALRGLPTAKLIAASTADVYPAGAGAHAESETPAPDNPYGVSKLLVEEIVAVAARTNPHLSCISLRLFNVYGPGDNNPHVIPRIVKRLSGPEPEIRIGATETTRDFVHVADVVRAICRALQHEPGNYEVFNVGTGRATSIRRVMELLLASTGDRRQVVQDKRLLRDYDRPSLTADITKIGAVLNWRPTIAIEQGLAQLMQQAVMPSP
jgi:UDP-glucose 4-epimerase